jgi:tRNA-splicing ligase RtcB
LIVGWPSDPTPKFERLADRLRDEAPGAYKNIGAVMRAQRELTRIMHRLRPLIAFKGA